ncbi:RpiR family transcriptional regulator [Entomoplasma freundtii]|uniref:Uncharacterized protein n=1 Tax=Entomoplasma freundtii TaxID=74700 RepID=A0A2K8NSV3_9MOLU|nr:MurR/RpiR family transcriptional regulator [Entomoplasma freundtii]ATZ16636.1 hypothetical protein EFREU_v1c06160 [Entomoplasma freundtii]TDY58197.1 RpiR family transcriptional regulator [Entomoplasma freundtii]
MASFLGKLATIDENNLTSREKEIVKYIKNNIQNIVATNMKIAHLAQEVGTGFSAIYALLKKMGINGYPDFMISLRNDAHNVQLDIANDDEKITSSYTNLIMQNYALLDKRSLFETLKLIRGAERIFVCYWEGVLKGPALELDNFFYANSFHVSLLDSDWDTINQRIEKMHKDDLFIFYTKYGTSTHLEKVIQKIKNRGGKVVLVSGKVPTVMNARNVNSYHTLMIETDTFDSHFPNHISKSVPFYYFNDLLAYHYKNWKKK